MPLQADWFAVEGCILSKRILNSVSLGGTRAVVHGIFLGCNG